MKSNDTRKKSWKLKEIAKNLNKNLKINENLKIKYDFIKKMKI
jgi:hypothetical protein